VLPRPVTPITGELFAQHQMLAPRTSLDASITIQPAFFPETRNRRLTPTIRSFVLERPPGERAVQGQERGGGGVRIAVVTGNSRIADPLIEAFAAQGHPVVHQTRGAELFVMLPDLDAVILDANLPDLPGIHVLQRLREFSDVPVIVLISQGDEHLVIRSLQSGADDCVTKSARPAELMARLDAIMRRWLTPLSADAVVVTGDVAVNLAARSIEVAGVPVGLTRTEFDIAATLAEWSGTAVSREFLTGRVWGEVEGHASRPLDVHIAALRAKLKRPGLITTVRGFGYRWGENVVDSVAAQ